jgi:hypothetical protein
MAKFMAAGGTNPLLSMARIVSSVSAVPLAPNGGIHWVPSECTSAPGWDQSVSRRSCPTEVVVIYRRRYRVSLAARLCHNQHIYRHFLESGG